MENLVTIVRLSGAAAGFFLVAAAATGVWGARLRGVLNPKTVMTLHRTLGLAGMFSGVVHGLVYYFFLR